MKMWKENKLDQEWEMDNDDIAIKFWLSKPYRELVASCWPLDRAIRAFLTDPKDGLNSVFDEKEYEELYDVVRESWPSMDDEGNLT